MGCESQGTRCGCSFAFFIAFKNWSSQSQFFEGDISAGIPNPRSLSWLNLTDSRDYIGNIRIDYNLKIASQHHSPSCLKTSVQTATSPGAQ